MSHGSTHPLAVIEPVFRVGLERLSRHPTEVGEGPARTVNMPLKSAAGAEADPPIVAAFFKRSDLMAAQFAQRLWMDAKDLRHCRGGHPIVFKHQGVK